MKIYDTDGTVTYDGELNIETLDFTNANCGDSLLIPINDENLKQQLAYTAWRSIQGKWCGSDDDKLKVYLYIDMTEENFRPCIQFEAFPYLPSEKDIQSDISRACDEYKEGIKAYYDRVNDWYSKNTCGLFDTLDVKLTDSEQKDLLWVMACQLIR